MSSNPASDAPRLLYCRCAYAQVVPQDVKDTVLSALCAGGRAFDSVADLCEMSARRDPRMETLAAAGPLRIAACHPRAVKWLFHATGHPLPENAEIVNMRNLSAGEAADAMTGVTAKPEPAEAETPVNAAAGG